MKINFKTLLRKPSTVKEATEKRDSIKLLSLVSLAVAIACTVLGSAVQFALLETLGMIVIIPAIILCILWGSAKKELGRMQNIYCECGEKFLFPSNVAYEITEEQTSSGKDPKNDNVITHTNTKVLFHCTCEKCGKEHSFGTSFITERKTFNKHGVLLNTKTYPLDQQLEGFFNA